MSELDLAALKELAEKATEGPFVVEEDRVEIGADGEPGDYIPNRVWTELGPDATGETSEYVLMGYVTNEDARFHAVARESVLSLIARIEAAEADKSHLDRRILEIAQRFASDYPNVESVSAVERLYAIEESFHGTHLANVDVHEALDAKEAELATALTRAEAAEAERDRLARELEGRRANKPANGPEIPVGWVQVHMGAIQVGDRLEMADGTWSSPMNDNWLVGKRVSRKRGMVIRPYVQPIAEGA